jgi:predicted dinucleotide-binding enzyme
MSISILGTGNMAKGLAGLFARAGYDVVLGSRHPEGAVDVAKSIGSKVRALGVRAAADASDLIVLAVPFGVASDTIDAAGGLAGKTIIDITNPLTADYQDLTIGHTTSAAEEIQRIAPGATVVKAFNTLFAQLLVSHGRIGGVPATVFIAGDDKSSNKAVEEIVVKVGLTPLQTGGLKVARYLEPVAGLNISLGYACGFGTNIAPAWIFGSTKPA